ncbi:MAG TPA: hypothetical protein VE954_38930 [Oligoflexus sp.]|uniref:hypothetical protein n=1 Tax=Oligoflexus sp. TaxID=1971216 RepID=UPI002D48A493|nr:hypothetical protein [Oligoflexus sp.]HYX39116.1 hypothetical protein [Oligoflexus sp.]
MGDSKLSTFKPQLAETGEDADKNPVPSSETGVGNTLDHLSGSALSGAFSKALMRSSLLAAEKARILTVVTSETDPAAKERLRWEWLLKLQI